MKVVINTTSFNTILSACQCDYKKATPPKTERGYEKSKAGLPKFCRPLKL